MRFFFLPIIIFLLTSCSKQEKATSLSTPGDDSVHNEENGNFKLYLSTLDKVDLPVIIRGCGEVNATKKIREKGNGIELTTDNSYFKTSEPVYGQIPTNGEFLATISLGVADCFIPILTTFNKNGTQIDRKSISIGYCGSDCGYSCSEFMSIDRDYAIFTSDTVMTYDCDSLL
jgi:hypothetical protein